MLRLSGVLTIMVLATALRTEAMPLTLAGDYYVSPSGSDSWPGSAAQPFATIARASSAVAGGGTVHVAPGTYTSGPFTTAASGSSTTRVRYVSDQRWKALIRTTGTGMHIAWTNNGSYVDIEGFDLSCNGRIGILNMGSFCRMIGNHVHDIPAADVGGSGGAGINNGNYSAHDNDMIGNVVHHVGPSGANNTVHGLYHSNLRGRVVNNIAYKNSGWGVHTWHAANQVTISNNLLFENGRGGIIVGAGDSPGGVTADNFLVSNNICIYNGDSAVIEYGATGPNNKYLNNLIWGNARGLVLAVTPGPTISADPKLVNYQSEGGGDYHLAAGSPCIDAGTSQGAPSTDFDGASRPKGAGFDIGPYEYAAPANPPPVGHATSIWSPSAPAIDPPATDPKPVELGVKFRSEISGYITGIRFYKAGSSNAGPHVGNLWTRTGTLLGSARFTGETASGWQQVDFASAVAISANTTYVASYFAPAGGWCYDLNYFVSSGADSSPLHALADGVDGPNGVYVYASSSAFPTQSYQSSNYWVDVVFSATKPATPPPPSASESDGGAGNRCGSVGLDLLAPLGFLWALTRRLRRGLP
jgi:hypothetical protein